MTKHITRKRVNRKRKYKSKKQKGGANTSKEPVKNMLYYMKKNEERIAEERIAEERKSAEKQMQQTQMNPQAGKVVNMWGEKGWNMY
jgi:hypothetical protein